MRAMQTRTKNAAMRLIMQIESNHMRLENCLNCLDKQHCHAGLYFELDSKSEIRIDLEFNY